MQAISFSGESSTFPNFCSASNCEYLGLILNPLEGIVLQVARDAAFATVLCNLGIWDVAAAEAIAEAVGAGMFDIKGAKISLSEMVKTNKIPEPLIVTHPDRLTQVIARIVHSKS